MSISAEKRILNLVTRLLEIEGYTMSAESGSWLGVTSFEDKSN